MMSHRISFVIIMFMIMSAFPVVKSFLIVQPPQRHGRLQSLLMQKRRKACIPLLDLLDSESADKFVTPLPSAHLPMELSSLHLYGMQLERPVHKMIIDEAIYGADKEVDETGEEVHAYGYIVKRKSEDSLVGAVGCTAEVLINQVRDDFTRSDVGNDVPITVLCKGSYRFVVKEVVKTIPYPVGIVEELVDEAPLQPERAGKNDEEEEDDDDDDNDDDEDNPYADLDSSELVRRTMVGLHILIDQKLNDAISNLSPLEKSILDETGFLTSESAQEEQSQAEEMAAVLDVFQSSLIDIAPMPIDRYYAIGMLAAQMANVDNRIRDDIITMTDGLARLRVVLREIESTVNMNRAKKMARTITDGLDEDQKELKVGEPQLPPWTKSIKDGTRLEYFWNEQEGWCSGVVVGEPVKIVDEIIVTVLFDDGETHRLPFTPEQKVRWRPPQD